MSIGNFNETRENNEVKETSMENLDKPRNQILEVPEGREDDFDKKLDENEENRDTEKMRENGEEKQGFIEKMKSFLEKPKNQEKIEDTETSDNEVKDNKNSFKDELKADAPTQEEQAEIVEKWKDNLDSADDSGESSGEDDEKQHGDGGERIPGDWER